MARKQRLIPVTFSTPAQAAEGEEYSQRNEAVIMNISAVSTNPAVLRPEQADPHRGGMRKAFEVAAGALGMTRTDLRGALANGNTIASLAQAKGIGTDRLTSTISTALTNADASLNATTAQQLAQRVVAAPPAVAAGGPGNDTGAGTNTASGFGDRAAGRQPSARLDQTDRIHGRQLAGLARLGVDRLGVDQTGRRDTDNRTGTSYTPVSQAVTAQARYADAQSLFGTTYGQQDQYASPFGAFA
jgi:hypothetical protein